MAEIFLDVGEVVTIADVLLALSRLLGWLVVVGLCAVVVAFVYSILWPLNKVVSAATGGLVGSVPGTGAVEHAVTAALGASVSAFDKEVGAFWHGLKRLVVMVGEEIFGLAVLGGYLWWYINVKLPEIIWHKIGRSIHSGVGEAKTLAKDAERDAIRADKYAHKIARHLSHRISAVEHTIDVTIPREIKTTRDLAQEAEDAAAKAWNLVKTKPWEIGATAFAGAVAVALQALGLGKLNCPQFGRFLTKWGCGLGSLLDALLGLAISALALENVCTLLPIAETAFGEVVGPVTHLLTEVPLGGCETPPKGWRKLSVATGPLPPAQTLGTLAA